MWMSRMARDDLTIDLGAAEKEEQCPWQVKQSTRQAGEQSRRGKSKRQASRATLTFGPRQRQGQGTLRHATVPFVVLFSA